MAALVEYILEYIPNKVTQSEGYNTLCTLLVLPNKEVAEFTLKLVGGFLQRFGKWSPVFLWSGKVTPAQKGLVETSFTNGAQRQLAKMAEVQQALDLIKHNNCVSSSKLTHSQPAATVGVLLEVKRLQADQKQWSEQGWKEWRDPQTKKLKQEGQMHKTEITTAVRRLNAMLQELESCPEEPKETKQQKTPSKDPQPAATGSPPEGRGSSADGPPPKRWKTGLAKPPGKTATLRLLILSLKLMPPTGDAS